MQPFGFVTISDHNYFPGVRALINSIRRNAPAPITVIDEGLRSEQLEWLRRNDVETRRVRRSIPVNDPRFGCCYALFDIDAAPYERIVCIDPDAIVLTDVRHLARTLDDKPIAVASGNSFRHSCRAITGESFTTPSPGTSGVFSLIIHVICATCCPRHSSRYPAA